MMIRIIVDLDDSTLDGWNAYDLIRETCKAYGIAIKVYAEVADTPPPPPPPPPEVWRNRAELSKALADKWNKGRGFGGVAQSLSPDQSSYHKPPQWLAEKLRPLGLLQKDGNCKPWQEFPKPLPD